MTSRSFRHLFPQLNLQSIPEDEFYRQVSLSQLLTGPDEQQLASFRPDVMDLLELVEATPELAGMLGSSLEFVDTRWDSLEASPPPTPPPPPRLPLRPLQRIPPLLAPQRQAGAESGHLHGLKHLGYSALAAKLKTKMDANAAAPHATLNANMREPQRQQGKNTWICNSATPDSKIDSSVWEQLQQRRSKDTVNPNSATPDSKVNSTWEQGNKPTPDASVRSNLALGASMWQPQRLRSRSALNSDSRVDAAGSEPQRVQSKNPADPANSTGAPVANTWTRQTQGSQTGRVQDSTNPGPSVDGRVWERL